jgi:hypothetical protein
VERWIREVTDSGVFPVFVIIDSPEKDHSILDQLACTFKGGEMKMDRCVICCATELFVLIALKVVVVVVVVVMAAAVVVGGGGGGGGGWWLWWRR